MTELFEPWEDVKLKQVPYKENYGFEFPAEMNQLMRELALFRQTWDGKIGGSLERWEHGLNIVRMLWSNDNVKLYAYCQGHVIWNTYFLNTFKKLCDGKSVSVTGPAAASKTFGVSVYMLCCFYSAPTDTSALLSTTSGSSAERRVWGQIKELHNSAMFDQWIDAPEGQKASIGRTIDYLKCITFDPGKEIDGTKSTGRDLRNGVVLIPIANDSTGENALDTVMGTHNKYVLWAVDEMPTMMDGIMRPRSNLASNNYTQFIGIGNAAEKTDPHGAASEPFDGWESIDENITRQWRAKTLDVLFLHGEESPNDHPLIDQNLIRNKSDYPFPYLSNKISRNEIAEFEGNGDIEEGKTRLGYKRFAIGFWAASDAKQTVLTEQFVRKHRAHEPMEPWGADGFTVFWSLDPAFTSDGDENILFPVRVGRTYNGQIQIVFPHDGIKINPTASTKEDYRMLACKQIQAELLKLGAKPEDGGMDAMGDGGLMYKDLAALLNSHKVQTLSSIGKSNISKYGSLVAEYWYGVQEFIQSGYVRGFNLSSGYAKDLFARQYYHKNGKIWVETKKEMKKRIGRSPDRGDAATYACYIINSRLALKSIPYKEQEMRKKYQNYFSANRKEDNLWAERRTDYEEMVI